MKTRNAVIFLILLTVAGCAPIRANLAESEYRPDVKITSRQPKVASYVVINRAPITDFKTTLGIITQQPLRAEEPFAQTVTSDIKQLLAQTLAIDPASDISAIMTIHKADIFYLTQDEPNMFFRIVSFVPVVGIISAGRPHKVIVDIYVSVELRQNGKIINNYQFEKQASIYGIFALSSDVKESYEKMVAEYRNTILPEFIEQLFLRLIPEK
jgi:hypothetical protein